MTELEKDLERNLVDRVIRYRGLCLKWVCPGHAGVPDRIVLLPGGKIVFAELKRPRGGRRSPLQKRWAKTLSDLGFRCWTIWNSKDLYLFEQIELRGLK